MRHFLVLLLLLITLPVLAQNPAKWSLSSTSQSANLKQGDVINARLKAEIESGWHLYALEQPEGGPIATTIKISDGTPFETSGKIESPKPITKTDPLFTGADGKPLLTKFFTDAVEFS